MKFSIPFVAVFLAASLCHAQETEKSPEDRGKDGKVSGAKFESAINRHKQDVTYCIPEEAKREAVRVVRNLRFDPQETETTQYTYVIYRYHEKKIEPLKKTDSDPESEEN